MGSCTHQSALTEVNGVMAGAVRISLGYMTTYNDCDRVIDFIIKEYVQYGCLFLQRYIVIDTYIRTRDYFLSIL